MNEALYIPFDTETGGIGPEVSLLTAHFAVCDKDLNIIDELDLAIKPNNGLYTLTAEALTINKIDIIAHDKIAITESAAGARLRDFIWKHSQNGKVKLIPVGKNIAFDVKKVNDKILGEKTWNMYVSYRTYDITSLIFTAKRKGKLAADAPESLEGLAKYFGIEFVPHTARGDNYAGIETVKRLEALL